MVGTNRQRVGLGAKKKSQEQTLSLLSITSRCKAVINTDEPRISWQKYTVSSSLLSLRNFRDQGSAQSACWPMEDSSRCAKESDALNRLDLISVPGASTCH